MDTTRRTGPIREAVTISVGGVTLDGDLTIPEEAIGLVIFAHGSGSGRKSPRNRFVADVLNDGRIGTLLFDLLTPQEEVIDQRTGHLRFDIDLLSRRLIAATDWIDRFPETREYPIGYFGASTGAAAALMAAAQRTESVAAVVSRGGRPDLAGDWLLRVAAPTLLIVGGRDEVVIPLNRQALARLRCDAALEVVPGATHLFEEAGTLEKAADLARRWFVRHLPRHLAHNPIAGAAW